MARTSFIWGTSHPIPDAGGQATAQSIPALFFTSWIVQGLAQWDTYRQEQQAYNEPIEVVGFITDFAQSTLEN